MSEFECRYFFEEKPKYTLEQMQAVPILNRRCLYGNYHKTIQSKKSTHLTTSVILNESEFDAILQYTDNKPMCVYFHGQWFELDHFKFKNKYSRVYPKYNFPNSFEIECMLLDKQPITST